GTEDFDYVREMHRQVHKGAATSADSLAVEYPKDLQEEPEIFLSILDQFVLYSGLFEELRNTLRYEPFRDQVLQELASPIRAAPYFRLSVVYDQLKQLGVPAEAAAQTIRWVTSK